MYATPRKQDLLVATEYSYADSIIQLATVLKSIRVHLAGRKSAVTPLYYGRFRIFNAQRASLLA